eukprot:m.811257 g.811257  ORF g.811257 m.811257 type:complete len:71 (-) comp59333_c0_seq10:37-249(-)
MLVASCFLSKVVLSIVKLGYDVTWCDSDILWFRNPMPYLATLSSDFAVQSNAPLPAEPRRLRNHGWLCLS